MLEVILRIVLSVARTKIASRRGEARATIEPRPVAPLHPAARGVVLLRDHFEADYHINGADGRMVFYTFFSYPKVVLARTHEHIHKLTHASDRFYESITG
uniref:Uncharacterized protein n=1 Tax=Trichogramma kaykai TaxID=54128 RepID=A0ABD2WDU0_9HYME